MFGWCIYQYSYSRKMIKLLASPSNGPNALFAVNSSLFYQKGSGGKDLVLKQRPFPLSLHHPQHHTPRVVHQHHVVIITPHHQKKIKIPHFLCLHKLAKPNSRAYS